LIHSLEAISIELIERVDSELSDSGQGKESLFRNSGIDFSLCLQGPLIPIAEGLFDHLPLRVESNIVHGPTIDSHGCNSARRQIGAEAEPGFDASADTSDIPA
jgi:hypothetical protein